MNGADLVAPVIAFVILLYFSLHIPWVMYDQRRRKQRLEDRETLKRILGQA